MYKNLKKAVVKKASRSSFMGIPQLVGSEPILLKLLWLIAIAISCSYCFFIIASNIAEYHSFPVITNINRVYNKEPEFPMVTICKINLGLPLGCTFKGKICRSINFKNGCLKFNSDENGTDFEVPVLKSDTPGVISGLKLRLEKDATQMYIELFINNQSLDTQFDKAIRVSHSMETNLVISRVFYQKLGYPYSNCKSGYSFELGAEDRFNRSLYPYYQTQCFYLCKFEKFFQAINKSEEFFQIFQYYFTNYNKWYFFEINEYFNYTRLYRTIYENITNKINISGLHKFCEDICPIECNMITYTITPYYVFNSFPYSLVNIYYDDFYHTEINEIPKITADVFISNLGKNFFIFPLLFITFN